MPKDLTNDIKTFLLYGRGDEKNKAIAKRNYQLIADVSISTKDGVTKFKLRCAKYLYTIKIDDEKKAEKIKGSFPNTLHKIELNQKTKKEEKKKVEPKKKQQ